MDNLVILLGNLGKDPEVRYSQSGLAITNFSLAVTEKYKNQQGELQEIVTWIKVRALGKLAENIGNNLQKGSRVQVIGGLRSDRWENEGGRHKVDYVLARRIKFLDKKKTA